MSTKKTPAPVAYAAKRAQIAAQIESLQALLKSHEARAAAAPLDWGYVGDLGYIAEQLANIESTFSTAAA